MKRIFPQASSNNTVTTFIPLNCGVRQCFSSDSGWTSLEWVWPIVWGNLPKLHQNTFVTHRQCCRQQMFHPLLSSSISPPDHNERLSIPYQWIRIKFRSPRLIFSFKFFLLRPFHARWETNASHKLTLAVPQSQSFCLRIIHRPYSILYCCWIQDSG